ncbi:hypothetical protein AMTRI_Chr09g36970 [Amborella trichopoda]|uniref:Late embryogenesis abundant protein LEA-2 subgroup domain-containing protein n=1 Tax=Amborella trichopoda TaxID=13333 RepID=W1NM74_AMBTC|nr:NDR1/HIN1-like protein 12 [Amborella trichopoda]ERM96616.1 hypothetical protein AMTR_s00001p00271600 [Amborella trichopoda]|eukprot:XP_006829200.1 NDR1/HIN1-like protein 12 [Amborella trichopoda]
MSQGGEKLPSGPKPPPSPSPAPAGARMAYAPARPHKLLCGVLTALILLVGSIALVLWLVYRPYRPRFYVQGAAIYSLNLTSPYTISTSLQFTVLTRNPNRRVAIEYDRLAALVVYRNQAITAPVGLPPLHQERKSSVAFAPVLEGNGVPVSGEVVSGLEGDEAYGAVAMRLVFQGRMRYRGGFWKSAWYGIYVKCEVLMGVRRDVAGQVPVLGAPGCSVEM